MSTGPKRTNFAEGAQILSDDLNELQRYEARALQRVLKRLFQDEDGVVQSGVLDGLAVTAAGSGALAVDVSAGIALLLQTAGISDLELDSDFRWLELYAASADVALAAADPTNPRKDLIYIQHSYGVIDTESRNTKDPLTGVVSADPAAEVTHGPTITVLVATGTPAGSPSVPATPANSIPLAAVTVPNGATVAGDLTVVDVRVFLPTPQKPKVLAGGTAVDGTLSVTALTASGAVAGATVTGTAGVVSGGDVTASGQIKTPAAHSATTPTVLARHDATGAPADANDATMLEVERGSATNAAMRWDEGTNAWVLDQGDGVGDRTVATIGAHDGSSMLHNDHLALFMSTGGTGLEATLAGGGTSETKLVNHNVTGFDFSAPLFWVAQVTGRAQGGATTAVLTALVEAKAITATQVSVTIISLDGSNFSAGDVVTFRLLFIAPRIA